MKEINLLSDFFIRNILKKCE